MTYRERQIAKWQRGIGQKVKGAPQVWYSMQKVRYFRIVEAAIEATAPGRQNRKTAGWEQIKSRAHSRAIAAYKKG